MRTKYSFYNFIISGISSLILPIFGLVKVSLFINLYGSEINGLQLVFMQVITYLNIFELSFSLAFRQLMFKPLAENNTNEVMKIYHGAKKIFKVTGVLVMVVGSIIGLFLPFFTDVSIPFWQAFLYFIILLLPFSLSYFMMGPNFVIMADQKEFKVSIWIQTIAVLRMVVMIVVIYFKLPVVYIFIIEGLNIFIANLGARLIALKNYPWLKNKYVGESDDKFKENVKYTTIHRLASVANNNTDSLVISAFMNLTSVSIYGAYSYLTETVIRIINSAITAPMNSFGNLFSDKKRDTYGVFTEYFNFSSYLATIIGCCVFVVMNQFVLVWTGKPDYVLPLVASILFAVNIYYLTQRESIIIARDANGLFKEAKNNAYLMAFTKITLSIILIQKLGIVGVLLATTFTYWIIDFLYNPILVYKKVFNLNPIRYYKMVASRFLIAVMTSIIAYIMWNNNIEFITSSTVNLFISIIILGICVFVFITIVYWVCYDSFRKLVLRFIRIFKGVK